MSHPPKVGVFVYNGYQELEFWYPVLRLREAGAEVVVIGAGLAGGEAAHSLLGYPVVPNLLLGAASAAEFAALVVPGGKVGALAEDAAFKRFLAEAKGKGVILAAASQAAALLPDRAGLVARTTDEVPQWTRSLLEKLPRSSS